MKITGLKTFFVKPRWLFLKVQTDEGIAGWGEPIVEGWAQTVAAAVREMGRYLVGQDPRRIEHHWQVIYRGGFYRGGPVLTSALSGIEQALWDIKGKWLGVSVHEMLGGAVRERVRVYSHLYPRSADLRAELGLEPGKYVDLLDLPAPAWGRCARDATDCGFTAIKAGPLGPAETLEGPDYIQQAVDRVEAMRDAVGDAVDIALDFHGRVGPALARRLIEALEPYRPLFIEEPCLPENVDAMAEVARSTNVPIATGERLFTRWGFREVLEKRAAAVLQPDLSHAGGIAEVRKIAAMAESYYAAIAPHCPLGPISLAAGLQVDACTPNFLCQEQVNLGQGYLKEPFVAEEGYIAVPQGPGLGIEVDEEALAEKASDGEWSNPLWWRQDGAFTEW
jgi:galactonate dehydratase